MEKEDLSNGYERVANEYIQIRGRNIRGIGSESIRRWAKEFQPHSSILDLGCGTGIPVTKILIEYGIHAFAIDASPTLVQTFRENFPHTPINCEAIEDSKFFDREFDGIIAIGLIFLLPKEVQERLIEKSANALKMGGKLMFTSPQIKTSWEDLLTGEVSTSLGALNYKEILKKNGFNLIQEFKDEGDNYYFNSIKIR